MAALAVCSATFNKAVNRLLDRYRVNDSTRQSALQFNAGCITNTNAQIQAIESSPAYARIAPLRHALFLAANRRAHAGDYRLVFRVDGGRSFNVVTRRMARVPTPADLPQALQI
ncbi:hypothetical protein H9P43_003431 [Blastocladiella emersonii ATCC 22665]|nr:hypothetical protein H9P43_003431 [Blastocladiella emersonii ATCC 22665]